MTRDLAALVVIAVVGAAGGACFDPHYDQPSCGISGECPDGLRCDGDVCRSPASFIDGAIDDGRIIDGAHDDGMGRDAADAPVIDASVDAPLNCPVAYVSLGASPTRYRLIETISTWADGAADCNNDDDGGGFLGFTHLAVIGDEAERLTVTGSTGFTGNRWVGLEDMQTDNLFVWVTAEPTAGYPVVGQEPPWDVGDPDGQLAENCVRFKNNFVFEDKNCDDNNKVLCECDGFPPR